jgi:hypothetical protein
LLVAQSLQQLLVTACHNLVFAFQIVTSAYGCARPGMPMARVKPHPGILFAAAENPIWLAQSWLDLFPLSWLVAAVAAAVTPVLFAVSAT